MRTSSTENRKKNVLKELQGVFMSVSAVYSEVKLSEKALTCKFMSYRSACFHK